MKISPLNSISFTSTPLYNVKLRKPMPNGSYKESPATFSKLENNDYGDMETISHICATWHNAPFGVAAGFDFLTSDETDNPDKYNYYVVEGREKTGRRKIYSIAEFDKEDKIIELFQSNPSNRRNNIKGAGEVMLWGIAKHNKARDSYETFTLSSSNEAMGFYKKMRLDNSYHSFRLLTDKTDDFLRRIERKYHLDTEA